MTRATRLDKLIISPLDLVRQCHLLLVMMVVVVYFSSTHAKANFISNDIYKKILLYMTLDTGIAYGRNTPSISSQEE
ncbi:hypothetical protein BLOT_002967 [Blomia tropicalis]|nr:hypothetical protein BLOT_002967 [Blomia tropicalis]